jgi:hypothetical protein
MPHVHKVLFDFKPAEAKPKEDTFNQVPAI